MGLSLRRNAAVLARSDLQATEIIGDYAWLWRDRAILVALQHESC
jgi:hypothetical protein